MKLKRRIVIVLFLTIRVAFVDAAIVHRPQAANIGVNGPPSGDVFNPGNQRSLE
jgi:hypothetical protein